jgi:hypothetical protein
MDVKLKSNKNSAIRSKYQLNFQNRNAIVCLAFQKSITFAKFSFFQKISTSIMSALVPPGGKP